MRKSIHALRGRFFRHNSRVVRLLMISGLLAVWGCSEAEPPVADDAAMKRAIAEEITPEAAARKYFYPREIVDYFQGMDPVSAAHATRVDPLLAPGHPHEAPQSVDADLQQMLAPAAAEQLNDSEALGRNTWMIWCGGNEGFWDWLATDSLGFIDLLKLLDSRQRNSRFTDAGLINEPGMTATSTPLQDEFGLWLDVPDSQRLRKWRAAYVTSVFEEIRAGRHTSQRGLDQDKTEPGRVRDADGYASPGSYLSGGRARGGSGAYSDESTSGDGYGDSYSEIPPPDIYGISSGVVGLRLFPNPEFDATARARWDAERYYNDSTYSNDPYLVRPYRVGMSCAFCHASFHPLNPPLDVANPEWTNISGNIGAQYLRVRAVFANLLEDDSFVYHLLDSQPPGTIDTSLIASDNINNPNTMNAIFGIPQRALQALRNPPESLAASSADLPNLWEVPVQPKEGTSPRNRFNRAYGSDVIPDAWVDVFHGQGLQDELAASNGNPRYTPRILLDGADSIGAWGAFARVYLNIGTYYERWNQLHQPVLGFTPQKPFTIHDCDEHSVYWHATNLRVAALRDYFLRITPSMRLLSADGGHERLRVEPADVVAKRKGVSEDHVVATTVDVRKLAHGRKVFANNCIVCHSSIQPESSDWLPGLHDPPANDTGDGGSTEESADDATADDSSQDEYAGTEGRGGPALTPDDARRERYRDLAMRRAALRDEWAKNGGFWDHDPGQWLSDPVYREWAETVVELPDFWRANFLSTDYRIPVTVVGTNAGRAMATNALTGHVWEDFASESYRTLPSVGPITYFNPYAGEHGAMEQFEPRHRVADHVPPGGGGPGFYRVPTLISIWATAPLLHNNSLGLFNNDPSVEGRLLAFDDAIRKLLWPERRLLSSSYNGATPERLARDRGLIWRIPKETHLIVSSKYVPASLRLIPGLWQLRERYEWLRRVMPRWLPGLLLTIVAFALLAVSHRIYRTRTGLTFLLLAAVFVFLKLLSWWYPAWIWLDFVRRVHPWLLPLAVLILGGVLLLLPLSSKWIRRSGYGSLAAAIVITAGIYFFAGKLGDVRIGPIPAGTPVNLLANVNSEADHGDVLRTLAEVTKGLAEVESRHLNDDDTRKVLVRNVAPALMKINKCPDFVMDKGHYFPWFNRMTDEDKDAVIELLKTF